MCCIHVLIIQILQRLKIGLTGEERAESLVLKQRHKTDDSEPEYVRAVPAKHTVHDLNDTLLDKVMEQGPTRTSNRGQLYMMHLPLCVCPG